MCFTGTLKMCTSTVERPTLGRQLPPVEVARPDLRSDLQELPRLARHEQALQLIAQRPLPRLLAEAPVDAFVALVEGPHDVVVEREKLCHRNARHRQHR